MRDKAAPDVASPARSPSQPRRAAATIPYELGERVRLPAQMAPYVPQRDEPRTRSLWIYAMDPANVGLRQPTIRVEVPYEPLAPGPAGKLFAVEHGALAEDLRAMLDWPEAKASRFAAEPLELDKLGVALSGGISPTTGDPRFVGQMVYAVCQQVYDAFRCALGRTPTWGPWVVGRLALGRPPQLTILPCAFNDSNAYYDEAKGSLEFGYFAAGKTTSPFVLPGGLVFVGLSRDIIAHELTHALLDGMRAEFMRDTHIDVAAFHEAFADLVALFLHFTQRDVVEQAIADSHGAVDADLLLDLGRQFGEAINGAGGGALRRALQRNEGPDTPIGAGGLYDERKPREEHDRGSILVAAVFEAFVRSYKRRTALLFRVARESRPEDASQLSRELIELLAASAQRTARHFLRICIRAIDYCPPVDLRFGSYLRALITADSDAVLEDTYGYRDALIKAFRRRNIAIRNVRDLSEESLRWIGPDFDAVIPELEVSRLRFRDNGLNQPLPQELERRAHALGEFITADPARLRAFGLHAPGRSYGPIVIQSIRLAHRIGADEIPRHDIVAEVTQARRTTGAPFIGGATVVVGMDGSVRYIIRRRVDDDRRLAEEKRHRGRAGAARLDLRRIHRRRVA